MMDVCVCVNLLVSMNLFLLLFTVLSRFSYKKDG